MPRPPKEDTIHFLRVLGSAERQILLAAGDGNIFIGISMNLATGLGCPFNCLMWPWIQTKQIKGL